MAGLLNRTMTVIKAKLSKLLDRAEDPRETLDYSYEKQLEMLQNVKRGVADVVTAKKRLQLQTNQLEQSVVKLDTRPARRSGPAGRISHARRSSGRRSPAAAPGPRPAGPGSGIATGEAHRERAAAEREDRGVPLAEGSDQGPVLGRRGAGADRRGGDRDRRADGRHRPRDPAREGQDRADDRPRAPRSRSSSRPARSRTSPPATRPSSTASSSS